MTDRDELSIWTVYDHPLDYPDAFVARRWAVNGSGPRPTADLIKDTDLDRLRAQLERWHLFRMPRQDDDDRKIVEVWI